MHSVARVICYLPLAAGAWCQITSPAFEVASIKPSAASGDSGRMGQMIRNPGRISLSYVTLENLLAQAYRIKNFQIEGTGWLDSDRFDIEAKLPAEAKDGDFPVMLQTLLKERFKLAFHLESKALSACV